MSIACAVDTDCKVQPHPCERKTLETVRELVGNAMCWRGSRGTDGVLAALCPFSRFVHMAGGQSSRAWAGWGWRSPMPSTQELQGWEESRKGARDRAPGAKGGSVSLTHHLGAQGERGWQGHGHSGGWGAKTWSYRAVLCTRDGDLVSWFL